MCSFWPIRGYHGWQQWHKSAYQTLSHSFCPHSIFACLYPCISASDIRRDMRYGAVYREGWLVQKLWLQWNKTLLIEKTIDLILILRIFPNHISLFWNWRSHFCSRLEFVESFDHLCGLVVRGPGFYSQHYQIFWEAVGPEWGPLSLMSITEELLELKSSSSAF
jgi:hypothetical protein